MKYFRKYIIVLCFCLSFISIQAQEDTVFFFNQADTTYLYHTLLDAYTFHFSGIMAIKKINQEYRVIFSTETGATLFDFTVTNTKCKTNFVMKEMKNPLFIALIKSDLIDLIAKKEASKKYTIQKKKLSTIQDFNAHKSYFPIEYLVTFKKGKKDNKSISYIISDSELQTPEQIHIKHINMPILIEMNLFYNVTE